MHLTIVHGAPVGEADEPVSVRPRGSVRTPAALIAEITRLG
jgi:hypothetical protein